MFPPQPYLTIHTEHQSDAYVIELEGELDSIGCPDLDIALVEAERTNAPRIVLDLEQLTFIDAAGMRALLWASRRSAANGARLQMTRGVGHPADMFRLTALDQTLPLTDPALCPAIQGDPLTPAEREAQSKLSRLLPSRIRRTRDDSNLPLMGERSLAHRSA